MSGVKHGVCAGHDGNPCMVFINPWGWGKDYCSLCLYLEAQFIEPGFEGANKVAEKEKEILKETFERIHRFVGEGIFNYAGDFYERTRAMVEDAQDSYTIGLCLRLLNLYREEHGITLTATGHPTESAAAKIKAKLDTIIARRRNQMISE